MIEIDLTEDLKKQFSRRWLLDFRKLFRKSIYSKFE